MEIKTCQIFLALADTLHYGQTAERCHLSPSAISRQIQRLEQEIGQRLIDRDNRSVRLTPAGRHFLDYARKSIANWQQLKGDLSANQTNLSGEVSLFGSVTASYSMLTQILPTMREQYPKVEIKLRTGDQADGIERVLYGTEDSAIIAMPEQLPEKLAFLAMRQTPLRLIGPKIPNKLSRQIDHYLDQDISPDWQQLPIILAERGLARDRLLKKLKQLERNPNIYSQVAGHEAVVPMVGLGFGIALVPELVIEHSPKKETVRVLPWLNDITPFSLGLCTLKERLTDPLLKAVWDSAAQTYQHNS